MSFVRNQAVEGFAFNLINKSTGDAITSGTVNGFVTKDGGVQAALTNAPVHEGNGQWSVNITATEMDAEVVGLLFTHVNAVGVNFTIKTVEVPTLPEEVVDDEIDFIAAAQSPRKTVTDEGSVEERSIDELIKADRYAAASGEFPVPWGIRVARIKPRGTV